MTLSTNQKIAIFAIFGTVFIGVLNFWGMMDANSPDLIHTNFNLPGKVSSTPDGFRFSITNHGKSTGSYYLQMQSNEILISYSKSYDSNDYFNELYYGPFVLPKEDRDDIDLYLLSNESNLESNATVTLTYVDTSSKIYKTENIWNFYYELDDANDYQLKEKDFKKSEIL